MPNVLESQRVHFERLPPGRQQLPEPRVASMRGRFLKRLDPVLRGGRLGNKMQKQPHPGLRPLRRVMVPLHNGLEVD